MSNTILRDLVTNYFNGIVSNDVNALNAVLSPNGSYTFCESKELTAEQKAQHVEPMTTRKMNKDEVIENAKSQAKIDNDSNRFVAMMPQILDVNVNGYVVSVRARNERFDLSPTAEHDVQYCSHLVELEFNRQKNRICRVEHMLLKTDQRLQIT